MAKKLFLHVCCGPCAIMPILRLRDEGYGITAWFMNPNIQPLAEYLRRREAAEICAAKLGIEILFDDASWNLADWLKIQLPRVADASRCEWCCQSRLEAAALKAGELGFDAYTSSLLYSRYQPHEAIAAKGRDLSGNVGPEFIYRDFRVDWQEGIERSKDMGLYRQPYCGCVFSETERYGKKLARLARAAKDMAATEK